MRERTSRFDIATLDDELAQKAAILEANLLWAQADNPLGSAESNLASRLATLELKNKRNSENKPRDAFRMQQHARNTQQTWKKKPIPASYTAIAIQEFSTEFGTPTG